MDDVARLRKLIDELFAGLDKLPYHVYLGVPADANGEVLRMAFYNRADTLHPDRFYSSGEPVLREKVYAIYKRITEAYRVMGTAELRGLYEEQRAKGATRLDLRARKNTADKGGPMGYVAHPNAKKHFDLAVQAEKNGDLKGAKFNYQMALQLEPGNPMLKEQLERIAKQTAVKK